MGGGVKPQRERERERGSNRQKIFACLLPSTPAKRGTQFPIQFRDKRNASLFEQNGMGKPPGRVAAYDTRAHVRNKLSYAIYVGHIYCPSISVLKFWFVLKVGSQKLKYVLKERRSKQGRLRNGRT